MNNVIIGGGLLAKSFNSSKVSNCLFFCSGVSDSSEIRVEAFKREKKLLMNSINEANNNKLCFVYFSSVAAPFVDNKYFNHKINMENIIENNCQNYFIFRLPQVAGPVLNKTLLPTMIGNIYNHQHFKVFKNASRTIVDVEDIVELFEKIYNSCKKNKIINVCPGYSFKPEELVMMISEYLCIKPDYDLLDLGSEQLCLLDESDESKIVHDFFLPKKENYLWQVVCKYTPKIIEIIIES